VIRSLAAETEEVKDQVPSGRDIETLEVRRLIVDTVEQIRAV
jgi:hypothetical protein